MPRPQIDDKMVDEIVDEILAEGLPKQQQTTYSSSSNIMDDRVYRNIQARVEALEGRFGKYMNNYKTTAIELEKQITEKSEEFNREQEKQIVHLRTQLDDLRVALIRLNNEFRAFREEFAKIRSK